MLEHDLAEVLANHGADENTLECVTAIGATAQARLLSAEPSLGVRAGLIVPTIEVIETKDRLDDVPTATDDDLHLKTTWRYEFYHRGVLVSYEVKIDFWRTGDLTWYICLPLARWRN